MTLKIFKALALAATAGTASLFSSTAWAVEIEYWQYFFDARVQAMEQLIENFEAANPDITVKMTHFPYADYRTKVAAAILRWILGIKASSIILYDDRHPVRPFF